MTSGVLFSVSSMAAAAFAVVAALHLIFFWFGLKEKRKNFKKNTHKVLLLPLIDVAMNLNSL